jgi:hypothetical protein
MAGLISAFWGLKNHIFEPHLVRPEPVAAEFIPALGAVRAAGPQPGR